MNKKQIKQEALEVVSEYIIGFSTFITYAGENNVEMLFLFMDSKDFIQCKPIMEDIEFVINDLISRSDDTNPPSRKRIAWGLIDYCYMDLLDKAIKDFFFDPLVLR